MNNIDLSSSEFLKVLAHDLRWELVTALTESDYCVQELVKRLQQPQNLVSYHLRQLHDAKLLNEHRSTADGRTIYYSLDLARLKHAYDALGAALHPALSFQARRVPIHDAMRQSTQVLFLCTENSARSQMAEGLLRHLSGDDIQIVSAGTAPTALHPLAVETMKARGIDISAYRSKSVDEFRGQAFDYVITVCDRARENCPTFPDGTTFIHWSLPDPAAMAVNESQVEAFEQTALALETRIHYLLEMFRVQNGVHQ